MTLTQIRTEIRNITGISSTTVIADSVLNDLINKGQIILADEANLFRGYAYRNSVSGTGLYQMTNGNGVTITTWTKRENAAEASSSNLANMIRIYRVDFDNEKTSRIGLEQIHNISNDNSMINMSTSFGYYIDGLNLGIFPKPQKAAQIKVYYSFLPDTLSSDSDTPMLDTRYHECLVYYGAWKAVERLRDINLIPYFKNEWNEWKEKVILDRQRRAGESTFTINYKDF